ncbi:DUF6360 family protein [Halorussus salinisoli]|uniref:DUF6360 family protein n=1 Tax=Halorussus salinisoli TaxID=2558242 RepID=UPI0010C18D64|nr:DUF6360 family protein [Halorussus salinisoli]
MADRVLKVNAYTTLDLVDARAEGHGFEESAYATLNVTAPRNDPDRVELQFELDNTGLDALPTHADHADLSPEQARTLADDLNRYAEKVERAQADDHAEESDATGTSDD